MPQHSRRQKETAPHPPKHVSTRSQDTDVSGIAGSTISYGESLRLSQFPQPPSSVPGTPVVTEQLPEAVVGPSASPMVYAQPGRPVSPARSGLTASSQPPVPSHPPSPSRISPYDWHEGASSIDVDPTEDRLLSTSFITSLLQENMPLQPNRRSSGISEMTYPPMSNVSENSYLSTTRFSSSHRNTPNQRPHGARPLPNSFSPIPESHMSGDSETLYSSDGHAISPIRSANMFHTRNPGDYPRHVGSSFRSHTGASNRSILHPIDERPPPPQPPGASATSSFPSPSTPGARSRPSREGSTQPRGSIYSTKSPSFISRISSNKSIQRILTRKRVKPLPPVPLIPHIPISAEIEHRKADDATPLPDLVHRAGALRGLLEKGYHPHQSLNSYYTMKPEGLTSAFDDHDATDNNAHGDLSSDPRVRKIQPGPDLWSDSPTIRSRPNRKNNRVIIAVSCFVIVALVSRKTKTSPVCSGNAAGGFCDLDATCVCTSTQPGRCDGLAQSIINVIPALNSNFATNMTNDMVYNNIWLTQGAPPGDNCAQQALLIDVAPGIDPQLFPNRTQWARTALLWNYIQSQNNTSATKLQSFVQSAPWSKLTLDGPSSGDTSSFSTLASGFTFDFAAQLVSQPNVTFVDNGQPTNAEIAKVGTTARATLDRMYSFALASSTQRQQALSRFWTTVLQQKPDDLPSFMGVVKSSPILLPFDATYSAQSQSLAALLTSSNSSPFPPPLACYPGLSSTQIQMISNIESQIFGLKSLSPATAFDTNCYPDHPLYGVLDVLRLRLPFTDGRPGVPKQAAVINQDAAPRAVVYSGENLAALPTAGNMDPNVIQSDPRQYGTLNNLNHVMLKYLSSIQDVNVAIAFVKFVLSSTSGAPIPPPNGTALYQSLASLPALEVAIFGSINPSDIISVPSSFIEPSGSLLFGSNLGNLLRTWAISGVGSGVVWAELATSPLVIRDTTFLDSTFNQTWAAAAAATSQPTDTVLSNVIGSLKPEFVQ
ncbi:hypothetical protein BD779DRAFT_1484908 [Infundibulicybe gibba]|nr:hypothetical protein BD779DRAFT_1484908 [Infundibulicybe gibba]